MPKTGKNIYKRKDGRWEGRYAKYRNSNDQIVYGSIYGKTCAEVKERLVTIANESPDNPNAASTSKLNLIFTDVAEQWLSVTSLKVKPSTYAGYISMLDLHILSSFGKRKIQSITAVDVSYFAKQKLDKGRTDGKGGLSPKTVRDILAILKSILDFAWNEKIIANRLAIAYPKHQQREIRVLSRQEQSTLETVLTTDINIHKLGILLCLYTGLRIGEACALHWQDISPEYDMLSVRQTLQRVKNLSGDGNKTKIHIDTPKSKHSARIIPIPTFLTPYLRNFANDNHVYFLATDDTNFTEPRTMQNHFARIIKEANIADANYHALRHTFATRCMKTCVNTSCAKSSPSGRLPVFFIAQLRIFAENSSVIFE